MDKEQTELFHGIVVAVVSILLYYYFTTFANVYDLIEKSNKNTFTIVTIIIIILWYSDNGLTGKFIVGNNELHQS